MVEPRLPIPSHKLIRLPPLGWDKTKEETMPQRLNSDVVSIVIIRLHLPPSVLEGIGANRPLQRDRLV